MRAGLALFPGRDAEGRVEPWVKDGAPGGSRRLRDIATRAGDSNAGLFTLLGEGHAAAPATDAAGIHDLLVTDGTPESTRRLADIPAETRTFSILALVGTRAAVVAPGSNAGAAVALWRTDGTKAGACHGRVANLRRRGPGLAASPAAATVLDPLRTGRTIPVQFSDRDQDSSELP